MSTPDEHKATAPKAVGCFVLTVSDTKTPETDTGGRTIRELLTGGGHTVIGSADRARRAGRRGAHRARGLRRPARAGGHPDRRHRHHVARLHVRGGGGVARQAAARIRRALPRALLRGRRRRPPCCRARRWASTPDASSSRCRAHPTPAGSRSRSCCCPSWAIWCARSVGDRLSTRAILDWRTRRSGMSRSRRSVLAIVLTLVLAVFVGAAGGPGREVLAGRQHHHARPRAHPIQRPAGRPRRPAQAGAGARAGPAGRRSRTPRRRRPGEPRRSSGSGFLIDPNGLIVTNAHVVEDADSLQVRLADGRRFSGKVVGQDDRVDLALVRIEGATNLPTLPLGDSNRLRVGEFVHGARPSVRARAVGLLRNREPQGRAAHGGRARLRLHPDRCRDQSRQLRRPARQHGRAGGGRQQHGGAQRLHRLRDPVQSGEAAGAAARGPRARSSGAGSACRSPRSATTIWAG